jgi:orotate phosphoribosyltransferase
MAAVTAPPAPETAARTLQALRGCAALLEGHFLLSSGRHAGRYVQCALLLQHPPLAAAVCQDLAAQIRAAGARWDFVIGPAMGAVTFAYELGRALGVRALFAERAPEGGFALRRGFAVAPGERALVAEDVVTTGKSAREVAELMRATGAADTAVASIVNRSGRPDPFGHVPYWRCLDLEVPSFDAAACPLCRDGKSGPPVKPGSRPGPV